MENIKSMVIKSKLVEVLENKGYDVLVTDTASLVFFTDKPVTKKSYQYKLKWITSFGKIGALNYIKEN